MEGLEYNRITGFPTNVLEHLERSLSQYMSRYATVKVGIMGNPQPVMYRHCSTATRN